MRALVIDDSRATRLILRNTLKELGFDDIHDAANGEEALRELENMEQPDLMLVDWNMPQMNGYEFVCAVRQKGEYAQVPLMMVTTETEMEQVVKALEAGANEYVMKPFTKEMIAEKLAILGVKSG